MTSAERFYSKHYGQALRVGATPLDVYEAAMFSPGGRYALPGEHFQSNDPAGRSLVELGCGGAEALIILSRRHNFNRIVGIDVALPREERIGAIEIMKADLDARWPLEDSSVDYLMAMMILEHLYDPFHSFSEIRRVLKSDGLAFVNLPLVTAVGNRLRLALGVLPVTSSPYPMWFALKEWDGNHLHYFSVASIRKLAAAAGLAMTEVRGVGRLHQMKSAMPSLLASEITFTLRGAEAR